jgi:hypothetical protein
MGDKAKESKWICVSQVGAVVPTEGGGSRCLKRGDVLEGEYYEQIAPRVQGLLRYEDLDKKFKAQLEKERKLRSGESVPEEFRKAAEGDQDHDPRFDGPNLDAAEDLARLVQEEKGKQQAEKHSTG